MARPLSRCGQIGFVERIAKGFGPDLGQQRMGIAQRGFQQVHRAKAAGIVEGDARAVFHVSAQHGHVWQARGGRGENRPASRPKSACGPTCQGGSAAIPRVERSARMYLRAPPQRGDRGPGQPFGHSRRKGPAQIGAVDLGLRDDLALHHRFQPTADGFNFGQFGHRVRLSDRWAHCSAAPSPYKEG